MLTVSPRAALAAATIAIVAAPASASFHTWQINEVFSSADGSVQFIELREAFGANFEHLFGGVHFTTNQSDYIFPRNLPSSTTANKHFLMATAAFAALPNAPTPDYIIPENFFSISGDVLAVRATSTGFPTDSFSFSETALPINGHDSLSRSFTVGVNSPTNFAGQTGSVVVLPPSPACPCEQTGDEPAAVNVFDLLAYLDLWFAADAGAEFTGDEPASVDVFDLLAYLDCWFPASAGSPCP